MSGLAFGDGQSDKYDGMQDLGDRVRRYASTGLVGQLRIPDDVRDLGLAILVAEAEESGGYEPVGVVGSMSEASATAAADLQQRMTVLEGGGEPFCPYQYMLWARGNDGYKVLACLNPLDPNGGWYR